MTIIELWTLVAILPAVVWAIGWVFIERNIHTVPKLKAVATDQTQRVTAIVPAYNEQDMIERCVRSIMAQDAPNLDLIVIDDRSQDQTPLILNRLCNEFPDRLRVITNTKKPSSGNSKTHAILQSLAHTDSPWVCFMDADVWLSAPDAMSRALGHIEKEELDFLTLYPNAQMVSAWDKIVEPGCTMTFGAWYPPQKTNDPRSKVAMGNGAFMLIRRSTYDRVGGHEAIRDAPADDIALAQWIKAQGGRVMIVDGSEVVTIRMYPDMRRSWRGWSHIHANSFAIWQLVLIIVSSTFNTLLTWLSAVVAFYLWAMHQFDWESLWRTPALVWCGVVVFAQIVLWRYYAPLPVHRGWSLAWPITMAINAGIAASAMLQKTGLLANRWRGDSFSKPPQ